MPNGRRKRLHFSKLYSFSCIRSKFEEDHSHIGQRGYSRVVYCNDPESPEASLLSYRGNYVSTTKYTAVNFLPKSLFEQFRRVANIYFLVISLVSFSPLAPYTPLSVLLPLIVVVGATMAKEGLEDWKRRKQDIEANNRKVEVYGNDGNFQETRWKKIRVGDIIKVYKDDYFPADLLLLSSSYEDGICYVETMNLDGETNLKLKQALEGTSHIHDDNSLKHFQAVIKCEDPNEKLYSFVGTLYFGDTQHPLSLQQLLLRDSKLRNTDYVYGVVIFTGHDTKVMQNATDPPSKRSKIEKRMDKIVYILFSVLVLISFIGSVFFGIATKNDLSDGKYKRWYLRPDSTTVLYNPKRPFLAALLHFLTGLMLYGYLIPISLYVSIEIVKVLQSIFIDRDQDMYCEESDQPAHARTSNLNEELGQVDTILSDKTGTLTCNSMEFVKCSIAGTAYGRGLTEVEIALAKKKDGQAETVTNPSNLAGHNADTINSGKSIKGFNFRDERIANGQWLHEPHSDVIQKFFRVLAVCHTAIPNIDSESGEISYEAESPDEAAFVIAARELGFEFFGRTQASILLHELDHESGKKVDRRYDLLQVLEFSSSRKRMSVIVRNEKNQILLLCKGADSVMFERLSEEGRGQFETATKEHIDRYAEAGLRTLVIAYREIGEEEYKIWQEEFVKAKTSVTVDRDALVEAAANKIERDFILLGATAVEDKLQKGVPECIDRLAQAGLKIWVLTGDKMETAINIGYACSLLRQGMKQIVIKLDSPDIIALHKQGDKEAVTKASRESVANQIREGKSQLNAAVQSVVTFALIIDGESLTFALEETLENSFLDLAISCASVICCRSSPKQKARVTSLVKRKTGKTTLAVGDGANDVGMLQEADIGVGISGAEGMQAVMSSDFAIAQFRFLERLLLVHGHWCYRRISMMICYFFYKNIAFGFTLFWFEAYASFSGQAAYNDYYMTFYNVFFTSLPVVALGVFDQDVSARFCLKYPLLYQEGVQNILFKWSRILGWMFNGLLSSIIIFFFTTKSIHQQAFREDGHTADFQILGVTLYTCVVWVVNCQMALSINYFTWIQHFFIWGSIVFWYIFLVIYGSLPPSTSTTAFKVLVEACAPSKLYWLTMISSHLQLQKQGFLSAWTNSFVGPWDPSQGVYNPDDKIKLWLFLPGCRSSVVETAKAAVSKLRVVNSGIWLAPGDSEDVAAALSQALRNCIERALIGDSYRRFGDVFSRIHPFSQNEELFWRGQPTIEFIFAATEEAIFVHVIVSAKHIRPLSSCDMERVLKCSSNSSNERLSVIVSPHGIRGKLTGLCPSNLVKQVYFSSGRLRTSNGSVGLLYNVSQGSTGHLRGQNYYVEVTVGVSHSGMDKALPSNYNYVQNFPKHSAADSSAVDRNIQKEPLDNNSIYERTFIYPAEAVLVPILQTSCARSSLKRFWLQNWIGPSLTDPSVFMHWMDPVDGQWTEHDGIHEQHSYDSSSNSNDSSISSLSSNSSDSNYKMTTKAGDLEADADSLTCRQSRLSCNDQMERNNKHGSKRPRVEMLESHGQLGTVPFKSDYAFTGVENDQLGSQWAWDDDDNGICIDMQTLLSEFGDFGDLFENDSLPFGEPPGTAESQALMFSAPDSGEVGASPGGTGAVMDVSDQMLLHVGFPSFDSFNLPSAAAMEEGLIKNEEVVNNTLSIPVNCTPSCSTGEFDHLMKAEALMTFAPEYRAIETPLSEFSSSIFKSPYLPKSRNVESSNSSTHSYAYGATPHSPCLEVSDEKPGMPVTSKACRGKHDGNASLRPNFVYPRLESSNELHDQRLITSGNSVTSCEGGASSVFISTNPVSSVHIKTTEGTLGGKNLLSSLKTVLATEVDCVMFQAFMCRIRHTLLSSSSLPPIALSKLAGSIGFNQLLGDPNTITDNISSKYEMKKKEVVPVRIAGDMDVGMLDGSLNATVGVWRSVGAPKGAKPSNIDASTSLPNISFNEDGMLSYAQRQSLQELLDGMALLVQQATSFVDVTLDSDCGDGPYGWLALQEQCRRGFSCGPFMVHAGCGGSLASCHSLDIAGMELIDPLSVEVHASSVISLLQSDIKTALKSAFGNVDGPLSVPDWCKGCGQAGDTGAAGDVFPADSTVTEGRDSLGTVNMSVGDSISPSQTTASGMSSVKDGGRMGETCQKRTQESSNSESEQLVSRLKPSLFLVPLPAILVGYQDDWLKTSPNSLQHWEKAPFEPYALQKHMTYYVICPDIDPLTSAAADFFQQLGTVYSTCNLGTHSPSLSNQMDIYSGKWASAGFLLLDCPQSMKLESSNSFLVGSISDYFLSLSNGWDLTSFLKSLSKVLKTLKFGSSSLTMNSKDGNGNPCTVIYIICPFPEPAAVLQTVIESSVTVGSIIFSSEKDRRSMLHSQVGKALNCSAVVDEASSSSILTLSGFSIPKLVVQVVTVDAIFRVTNPSLNELVILKETAFAVYNKARRISRGSSNDVVHPSSLSTRSHSVLSQMTSPMSGMWKDCVGQQMGGTSLPREGELDASLRPGTWDNSWQATRTGDFPLQDDIRYMFEPLFVLAEPGSLEHAVSTSAFCNSTSDSSKPYSEDNSVGFMQSASSVTIGETGPVSQLDGSESDGSGSRHSKAPPSLHCSYGWTEDWRWLVCIWTDSRGELLDSHIFPFGGISSRQDTKGLQCLFVQMLQQGCQILQACCSDIGASRPRDFVITRIGCFYELECQEWQKAIYSVGASDVKKWPLRLRRTVPDRIPARSNGALLQQPETSLMQERNLPPSSPYTSHSKSSGFAKSGLGQAAARKQLVGGHSSVDSSRGLFQWVQSISLVTLSIDHSLYLLSQADSTSPGGTQGSTSTTGQSSYVEGFSSVKSLDSTSASWIMIPSPSMRFLTPTPLQLPSCLTAESPPLAHLLHSKGLAVPFSTGFVISKAVPSMRKDSRSICKEEWPSVLSVGIVDYYGSNNAPQEKNGRGSAKQGARSLSSEDFEIETHLILESVAAELHALSWMTVSPAYLERRTALPFHCDMVLRLRRLLYFADKELSRQCEKSQGSI